MPLLSVAADADLIAFVDQWAIFLEAEAYEAAFAYTEHLPERGWTPSLLRAAIKGYGEAREDQIVTLRDESTDISRNARRFIGAIWYDLNLDGYASAITATFDLQATPGASGSTSTTSMSCEESIKMHPRIIFIV